MQMRGADIVVECLKKEGVEVMYGIPGGSVLPLFDALYDSGIHFVLTRHEQGAAHMADGYARASGKVGVCLATSGPGATNLVTGLATANMDSIPVVAITGQVKSFLIGNDAFQEADVVGITRPVTKHNFLVKDVKELAATIKKAFYIARTGRKGVVLVDIPADIQMAETEFEYPKHIDMKGYASAAIQDHVDVQQVAKAAEMIRQAKRPLIYAGGGVISAEACQELRDFAHKISAPVTTTFLGLGVFDEEDPLSLKFLGMHGAAYANHAVQACDLLIAVGARFDDRVTGKPDTFARHAKKIHIEIDPAEVAKNVRVDLPVIGDAKKILKALIPLVKKKEHPEWLKEIVHLKKKYPLTYRHGNKLKPQFVIEEIYRVTKGEAVITTDVGQHQMWAAQFYRFKNPRTFISSGGLGTMGFGLPAAIGAKMAVPGKPHVVISGDGSIQMNIQELTTAATEGVPVIVAIMNNRYLGMVRQWQELFYKKRYSHSYLGRYKGIPDPHLKNADAGFLPDFVKLAEAFGCLGLRVEKKEEVEPALKKALAAGVPVLIAFHVEEEENVYPMVAAGKRIDEMIGDLA